MADDDDLQGDVLVALRRIMRATSLHSRRLGKAMGLTVPQLVVMRAIAAAGEPTASEVARRVSLSQATVTTILNRLEERGFLLRERSSEDRRRLHLRLTAPGREVLSEAPLPLQHSFVRRFGALSAWEQHQIVASLTRVAEMMDAEGLDAAPLLASDEVA
jgi:DNA-binding MarR family transcriptional regulator